MSSRMAHELHNQVFDAIIIGGGIIGAGVARDAAMRGLNVALFERFDYGSGTTAGSTRLIHGGLRYLEMLDFRLVRMDLRERETLLRIAPHLVKPLEFLLPFYDESVYHRVKMRLGMILYDLLAFDKSLPNHRFLTASEVAESEPRLRTRGLQGAASYFDAQVNSPERLCLENIIAARERGAVAFNYAQVTSLLRSGQTVEGIRVRDTLTGEQLEVRGRVTINTAGPWMDRVSREFDPGWKPSIRTTKGIHFACPRINQRALVLFSKIDGRLFFSIPWLGYSWIGTTDTDYPADPAEARAEKDDVDYLLRSVHEFFPDLGPQSILFTNAGVRALVRERGSESSVSRLHRIADGWRNGNPGMLSVLGGKITGYRAIAEEVTDLACRKLQKEGPCSTARVPLPGGSAGEAASPPAGMAPRTAEHIRRLYGSRAHRVMSLAAGDPGLQQLLSPEEPDIAAQVVYSVRFEQCERTADFLERRTLLGFSPDQGKSAQSAVAALMGRELDWSPERQAQEIEHCESRRRDTQRWAAEVADRSPAGMEACATST